MEHSYESNILFYNLKLNLSNRLKVIEFMTMCKFMNKKHEQINLFEFDRGNIETDNIYILKNIDNKLYQNLLCIEKYIKNNISKNVKNILNNLIEIFRFNVLEFFLSEYNSQILILDNFIIEINRKKITNFIFSKGLKRLEIFNMCCNNKCGELTKYIETLETPYRHLFLASLMVCLQVFSDGNHRTSFYYLSKQNFNIDKEIYKDFINFFHSQMYDFSILIKFGIKYYTKKMSELWEKFNKIYISKNNNGNYILIKNN